VTGLAVGAVAVVAFVAVVAVFLVGLARAAAMNPPTATDPVDVTDDELRGIEAELWELIAEADRDAVLNATRCDCAVCTFRREARRGRASS
jgi:hypothetical protein